MEPDTVNTGVGKVHDASNLLVYFLSFILPGIKIVFILLSDLKQFMFVEDL